MTGRSRTLIRIAALTTVGVLLAACGDDDGGGDAAATTEAAPETTAADATTTTAAPGTTAATGGVPVEVVESDLGPILASEGRTLYAFLPDDAGAPTCYDDCATTWPPLLADGGGVAAAGDLDAGLVATVARDDGGEQVTVDGWPLYFFANDAAPGDTNGQGIGDVWFVVAADGAPVEPTLDGLVGGGGY